MQLLVIAIVLGIVIGCISIPQPLRNILIAAACIFALFGLLNIMGVGVHGLAW